MVSNTEAGAVESVSAEGDEPGLETVDSYVRGRTNFELRYGRLEGSRNTRGRLYAVETGGEPMEMAVLDDMRVKELSQAVSDLDMDEIELWLSPEGFAALLSQRVGQHDIGLYDRPEEKDGEWPELPDNVENGIEEAAVELAELPVDSARVMADTYERDGDPQFLRYHEGEISDHVMREFLEAFSATGLRAEYFQEEYDELVWSR